MTIPSVDEADARTMATKPRGRAGRSGRRTQAERTALSDQRMFDAAIRLIIDRGTQRTTLKDIGETAGYSRGLANYRFGSKEGLLLALFARFDARWKAHLNGYVAERDGLAGLKAAARALRDFLKLESDHLRAMYILWYESLGHDSEIRARLANHHRIYREDATRWIRRGIEAGEIDPAVNAEQAAMQFCAFLFGTVYQWVVDADALDLEALFDDYEANVDRVLARRPP
jgi:AcrR family transcriptional regulator